MPRFNGGAGGTSRKHHRKSRGIRTSTYRYAARLAARGVTSKSVHMRGLDDLRKRAARGDTGQAAEEAEDNGTD